MAETVKRLTSETSYDITFFDHLHMIHYRPLVTSGKTILTEHNVESGVWKSYLEKSSGLKWLAVRDQWKKMYAIEKDCLTDYDHVFALTDDDAATLRKMNPDAKVVVCRPIQWFDVVKDETSLSTTHHALLFIASYDWFPNQEAARYLVEEIMPRVWQNSPDVTLTLVGKNPTPEIQRYQEEDRVTVTGQVDSVDPYIRAADVFVNPMFSGAGVNIKMLEAMGKKIPTVTSRFGARGMGIEHGRHTLVFDTPDEAAAHIKTLLNDHEKRSSMASAAREFAVNFSSPSEEINEILSGS